MTADRLPAFQFNHRMGIAGIAGFGVFLLASLLQLYLSNPNEDAFILFKYVNNVVAGHGVAYFPGGPRAEGATDFLWFVLLTGLTGIGFDVAVAAALLNAVGAGLAAMLFAETIEQAGLTTRWRAPAYALVLAIPLTGGALAAYEGFSSMLYSALVLWLFRTSVSGHARHLTPLVAIVVALFRPDGVIIGGIATLIVMWQMRAEADFRRLARNVGIAFTIGCVYFIGRYLYYGELLPLPLYVKSAGAVVRDIYVLGVTLPYYQGLDKNLGWLADTFGPTSLLVAGFAIFILGRGRDHLLRAQIIAAVPMLVLLLSLSLAHQAQNIALRFQAPIFLIVLYIVSSYGLRRMSAAASTGRRWLNIGVLAVAIALPSANGAFLLLRALALPSYMESMSRAFADAAEPGDVLTLTEAGRMAFWWPGPAHDLGGLNNADTAHQPANASYVASLHPDVVFLHPIVLIDSPQADGETPGEIDPDTLRG